MNHSYKKRQPHQAGASRFLVEAGESRTLLSITETISHDARHISYLSASSVREPSFQEAWNSVILESDPAKLLPRLLDQLTVLGQTAQQLRQALDNNRHHPDKVADLVKQPFQGGGNTP